jgi:hypothetical protein
VAKPRMVGGHSRTASPLALGVSFFESACGFVRRPIADVCDDPDRGAPCPSDSASLFRPRWRTLCFQSESIGAVWNMGAKKTEQPGNARKVLPNGPLTGAGILRKVGLVKAMGLGFSRAGRISSLSGRTLELQVAPRLRIQ